LQHLPAAASGRLVRLIDTLLARGQQMVFTANAGPQQLQHRQGRFPARLTSRLAAGMVVRLEPLSAEGRLTLLRERASHLPLDEAALTWLAEHLSGGRELLGALRQLELLAQVQPGPLDVDTIARHFATQAEASKVTVEQIAQRVSHYFQVEPKQLQSRRRSRHILVPRQVGMYLARQLTGLSLEQIGAYFGGRDHTTVLHACRKVEEALDTDLILCGAIRELSALGGQQSAREKKS
jgi:chromosomal replication initiator protein